MTPYDQVRAHNAGGPAMRERTARDLVTEWHAPKYVREHLIAKIATALAQARREEREACAKQVDEMADAYTTDRCIDTKELSIVCEEECRKIAQAIRQQEGA